MIKLIFEFETKYGVYRDALYLEENNTFTEQEVDAMKQQRVDNWLYAIENPPIVEPELAVEPEPVGD